MLRALLLLFSAAAPLLSQNFPPGIPVIPSKEARTMLLRANRPEYPRAALTLRIQGDVFLTVLVDEKGKVKQMKYKSGPSQLVQSSMDAVARWEFRPLIVDGRPTPFVTDVEVNYAVF